VVKVEIIAMSNDAPKKNDYSHIASEGTLLGNEGRELSKGIWENGVYLGRDGFVYHIIIRQKKGRVKSQVEGKRSVGEYLRWVDGLFRPGELPSASNAIHYRAARKLREII